MNKKVYDKLVGMKLSVLIEVNKDHSNITIITKKKLEPWYHWLTAEGKTQPKI